MPTIFPERSSGDNFCAAGQESAKAFYEEQPRVYNTKLKEKASFAMTLAGFPRDTRQSNWFQKVRYVFFSYVPLLLPKNAQNTRIHKSMGLKVMNFSFWPFLWFEERAGATPDSTKNRPGPAAFPSRCVAYRNFDPLRILRRGSNFYRFLSLLNLVLKFHNFGPSC